MSKQYGLIIPNKNKGHQIAPVTLSKPSIFNDDSDSDSLESKPTGLTKTIKQQDKLNQSKAVEEDPTVYQYDEIYDEMDQRRKESKLSRKDLDRKPKYISRLLATAEKRKRENERRIERQVQKEREEEGEQFKDKESFVTSAYKKKLEELRQQEEQEKREEYLETIGDVTKQGNLDGFYRHLYDQKVNYEDKDNQVEVKKEKEEPKSGNDNDKEEQSPKRRKSSDDHSESENKAKAKKPANKRKYRPRRNSEEEQSEEEIEVKKEHLPSNLDADSDFSIDSSDSEDENEKKKEKPQEEDNSVQASEEKKENGKEPPETEDVKDGKVNENVNDDNDDRRKKIDEKEVEEKVTVEVKPKKPKVDIWKKRTVGEKFDEAVKRYFERKAEREAGL